MTMQIMLQALSLVALLVVLVVTMQMDPLPASTTFNMMVMAVVFIVVGYLFELTSLGAEAHNIARILQYVGIMFAYPLNLCCTLAAGHLRVSHVFNILLFVLPVLAVVPLLTSDIPAHLTLPVVLGRTPVDAASASHVRQLALLYVGYPFLCMLGAAGVHVYRILHPGAGKRHQNVVNLFATALPPVVGILYGLGLWEGFNPFSMLVALGCVITAVVVLPDRVRSWASYAREQALDKSGEGYILLDAGNRCVESNAFAKRLFPELAAIGHAVPVAHLPELQRLAAIAGSLGDNQSREIVIDGRPIRISSAPAVFGGHVAGRSIRLRDESELRRLEAGIAELQTRDYETGLLNRRAFGQLAERDFRLAQRAELKASIIAMGADRMADLATEYGEGFGPGLRKYLTATLRGRLRSTDIIGRDGNLFLIFLPGDGLQEARMMADELRQLLWLSPYEYGGAIVPITVSFGISALDPGRHIEAASMIIEAEAALYTAQNTGGDRCCAGGPPTPGQ